MPQQAPVGGGDEENHQRIDLRALGLEHELDAHQRTHGRIHADPAIPQAHAQVVDQPQGAECGEQRRQHEGDAPVAHQLEAGRLGPHQHRRLVRIQLHAPMREHPVAAFYHLPGGDREARFVGGPWIAQADADAEHQNGEEDEEPKSSAFEERLPFPCGERAGVRGCACHGSHVFSDSLKALDEHS